MSSESWSELTAARRAAELALAEDLAGYGDLAGRVFQGPGVGLLVARQDGILSGTLPFRMAAQLLDEELDVQFAHADGARFVAHETIGSVTGRLASILALERTGLNFLGRLSGIATLTSIHVAGCEGTKARIAATRKTTPGLRALEKAAVEHGGGLGHRFGLFDAAMIKDNHVRAAGGVRAAIDMVRARLGHVHVVEVEVDSLEQLREALDCGAGVILLDNMTVDEVRAAVELTAGRALLEVSGGVTLGAVRAYAEAGVDIISVGALTTRAAWIDIAMDME